VCLFIDFPDGEEDLTCRPCFSYLELAHNAYWNVVGA
jgi:hypothetical protein